MSPEDRKKGVDDFIATSPVADEINIVEYQTNPEDKPFECGGCKKIIEPGYDHLLGIVTFYDLQRYTKPYSPRFVFHAGCTPVMTKKITFQDTHIEKRYKEDFHHAKWVITKTYLEHINVHVKKESVIKPPVIVNPLSTRLKTMEHE